MTNEQIRKRIVEQLARRRDEASMRMERAEENFEALRKEYQDSAEAFDLAETDLLALVEKDLGR